MSVTWYIGKMFPACPCSAITGNLSTENHGNLCFHVNKHWEMVGGWLPLTHLSGWCNKGSNMSSRALPPAWQSLYHLQATPPAASLCDRREEKWKTPKNKNGIKILKHIKVQTPSLLVSKNKINILLLLLLLLLHLLQNWMATSDLSNWASLLYHMLCGIQFSWCALVAFLYILPNALILNSESFSELSRFGHFKNWLSWVAWT